MCKKIIKIITLKENENEIQPKKELFSIELDSYSINTATLCAAKILETGNIYELTRNYVSVSAKLSANS